MVIFGDGGGVKVVQMRWGSMVEKNIGVLNIASFANAPNTWSGYYCIELLQVNLHVTENVFWFPSIALDAE